MTKDSITKQTPLKRLYARRAAEDRVRLLTSQQKLKQLQYDAATVADEYNVATYDRGGMECFISEVLGYLQAPKGGWKEDVTCMVAIQQTATQFFSSGETYNNKQKAEKPKQKCVNPGEWTNFIIEWNEYKVSARLEPHQAAPPYTEKQVLRAMSELCVTYNNRFMMKEALRKMTQGHAEPIQQFAAHVRQLKENVTSRLSAP